MNYIYELNYIYITSVSIPLPLHAPETEMKAYFKNKKYRQALKYFQQALEKAKETGSLFMIMDNYKYQADCYSAMKNYERALWYSNEYYYMKEW